MTKNGVSTTIQPGREQHEAFQVGGKSMVQYDYRHTDGQLFTCVADSLDKCREKRETWMKNKESDPLDRLNRIYDQYKDEFEGDFHNMLWQILVNKVFGDRRMAFHAAILDTGYILGIAEENKPGYHPSYVFFKTLIHREATEITGSLNFEVFNLNNREACEIVLTSMFPKDQ